MGSIQVWDLVPQQPSDDSLAALDHLAPHGIMDVKHELDSPPCAKLGARSACGGARVGPTAINRQQGAGCRGVGVWGCGVRGIGRVVCGRWEHGGISWQ